ncbi:MAG: 2-C-methyl-D-erythritol 2,4-cyclodiphosphate synthase, partial [Candidatus Eisenbacteria bacterium]|nr:2-C-methyl-D-erythritol 2,4-cyclodiphosphate synthase [Candidatus Eisenbacteria bacterium]
MRFGHGTDVHRLVPERALVLGGVTIPSELGLLGHSDADVLTHAIMDAMLGAMALGDIGKHFPPSEDRYRDASSLELLGVVRDLLAEKRATVIQIDSTLHLEAPKVAPYVESMRRNLAEALGLPVDAVSVK